MIESWYQVHYIMWGGQGTPGHTGAHRLVWMWLRVYLRTHFLLWNFKIYRGRPHSSNGFSLSYHLHLQRYIHSILPIHIVGRPPSNVNISVPYTTWRHQDGSSTSDESSIWLAIDPYAHTSMHACTSEWGHVQIEHGRSLLTQLHVHLWPDSSTLSDSFNFTRF